MLSSAPPCARRTRAKRVAPKQAGRNPRPAGGWAPRPDPPRPAGGDVAGARGARRSAVPERGARGERGGRRAALPRRRVHGGARRRAADVLGALFRGGPGSQRRRGGAGAGVRLRVFGHRLQRRPHAAGHLGCRSGRIRAPTRRAHVRLAPRTLCWRTPGRPWVLRPQNHEQQQAVVRRRRAPLSRLLGVLRRRGRLARSDPRGQLPRGHGAGLPGPLGQHRDRGSPPVRPGAPARACACAAARHAATARAAARPAQPRLQVCSGAMAAAAHERVCLCCDADLLQTLTYLENTPLTYLENTPRWWEQGSSRSTKCLGGITVQASPG